MKVRPSTYILRMGDPKTLDNRAYLMSAADDRWHDYKKNAQRFATKSEALYVCARMYPLTPCRVVRLLPRRLRNGTRVRTNLDGKAGIIGNALWRSDRWGWLYHVFAVDGSGSLGHYYRGKIQRDRGDGTIKRTDGKRVPLERWETGFRNIVTAVRGPRAKGWEIDEIVREVEQLACMQVARAAMNRKVTP